MCSAPWPMISRSLSSPARRRRRPSRSARARPSRAPASTLNFVAANAFQDLTVTASTSAERRPRSRLRRRSAATRPGWRRSIRPGAWSPHASGQATITVQAGGKQAQAPVNVLIVTLTSLSVQPSPIAFTFLGQSTPLQITAHYNDGTTHSMSNNLVFTTGNSQVATVSTAGVVTAIGDGSTSVTVASPGLTPVAVGVTVSTAQNTPPTVQIASPATGAQYERGDTVSVNVQYQSANGGVARVELDGLSGFVFTDSRQVSPPRLSGNQNFSFVVPPVSRSAGRLRSKRSPRT